MSERETKDTEDTACSKAKSKRTVVRKHTELEVYKLSFETAMTLFTLTQSFPIEERYSLTDQVRRCSRSVSANITEAWRKRRYPAAFVSKLSDAEAEAAETQTWLQYAVACNYLTPNQARPLYTSYDSIIGMLVKMIHHPEHWKL